MSGPAGGRGRAVQIERIGGATLYCGDCLDVLPDISGVDCIVADPPYSSGGLFRSDRSADTNVKYVQKGQGKSYATFSGDNRDQRSLSLWNILWMHKALNAANPSALFLCFADWRNLPCVIDSIQVAGWVYRGIIPWNKTEAARPQKGCFRAQCEYVVWGTNGPNHGDRVLPGFWTLLVPRGDVKVHPAQKPVELVQSVLALRRDDAGPVLDPFMGSGTAGVAALRAGRRFIGIEKEEIYFDMACRRIEDAAKEIERAE